MSNIYVLYLLEENNFNIIQYNNSKMRQKIKVKL